MDDMIRTKQVRAWMINHISLFYVDVIIYPSPDPNAELGNLCR